MEIHDRVTAQFAPTAASYATSQVHANSDELAELVGLAGLKADQSALDVATGAGHMGLAVAPQVANVVLFDLTQSMLDQAASTAADRGLTNVEVRQGAAESLPFENQTFDLYTVRLAPHHFADIRATLDEAFRVLKPGGRYLVVDTTAPEDDVLDSELNEIELLRDPSHVRNYRISEWLEMLRTAGFTVDLVREGRCGELEFHDWTRRQNVPADRKDELHRRFSTASGELRALLTLRSEGDTFFFTLPQVTVLASK